MFEMPWTKIKRLESDLRESENIRRNMLKENSGLKDVNKKLIDENLELKTKIKNMVEDIKKLYSDIEEMEKAKPIVTAKEESVSDKEHKKLRKQFLGEE